MKSIHELCEDIRNEFDYRPFEVKTIRLDERFYDFDTYLDRAIVLRDKEKGIELELLIEIESDTLVHNYWDDQYQEIGYPDELWKWLYFAAANKLPTVD